MGYHTKGKQQVPCHEPIIDVVFEFEYDWLVEQLEEAQDSNMIVSAQLQRLARGD